MIPWEKDIILNLMIKEVEEENLKKELAMANKRAQTKKAPMRKKNG